MHKRINEDINVAEGTAGCLSLRMCVQQYLDEKTSNWGCNRAPPQMRIMSFKVSDCLV